ncbi:MAG: hypothetical protein ACD_17C00517G0001, partial [uncultured bacterium]
MGGCVAFQEKYPCEQRIGSMRRSSFK